MTETQEQKAMAFVSTVINHLEDIAQTPTRVPVGNVMRARMVGTAAGLALATVLQHIGWIAFFRIVFGSISIRYNNPGLVQLYSAGTPIHLREDE